jgi:hypothetical protein
MVRVRVADKGSKKKLKPDKMAKTKSKKKPPMLNPKKIAANIKS